ncbi:NADH-quinone oxidoreductase subunit NuoE [Telmatospirillum siberiense]|uniref:NADH-quinone oxidoreductase subunit NuoE n=1 Tax=Telmatospirillum siberiense TaxID=382514 RepID=A0A2N3PZN2_9PROT|nr:NADH-quinone oxidoreductase subunit NuoE [Telmatospirillum siberiense]PKU25839.1 NADH-quinone oxidoreductase subunit NuoE [Telmatospirillum siberiense]
MSSSTEQSFQPASFAFSEENRVKAQALIAKHPEGRQRSAVIPLLDLAQRQEGWVSLAAMDHLAEMLGMARIEVYEVATFYSMFKLQPVGRYHLQVCTNLPCMLRGSAEIVETCEKELGVGLGETTPDGLFTLSEVECLGACVNAPVIWIGDDYYEDLDIESTKALVQALKRGETPRPGSQTGRSGSAPQGGPTTLTAAGGSLPSSGGDA